MRFDKGSINVQTSLSYKVWKVLGGKSSKCTGVHYVFVFFLHIWTFLSLMWVISHSSTFIFICKLWRKKKINLKGINIFRRVTIKIKNFYNQTSYS